MNQDRIARLERKLELVAREIAGLPVALARSSRGKADSASGVFVCTLSGQISAGSESAAGVGSGTVKKILPGGQYEDLGTRIILNPFVIALPATVLGKDLVYPCSKTHTAESEDDDEYTLLGNDPLHLLASLDGYGQKTSLSVGLGGGSSVDDMEWLGGDCEE